MRIPISSIIISGLILGMLILGFYEFANDLTDENSYNVDLNDNYTTSFDKAENLSTNIAEGYNDVMNWSAEKGGAAIITLVPDALMLVKDVIVLPVSLTLAMFDDAMVILGAPAWISTLAIAVLIVIVIFAFIALILRFKDT